MSKIEKLIASMKKNPKKDWKIDKLKRLADKHDVSYRQPGTSHVTFCAKNGKMVTVPSHKPIKPIYIKMFLKFLKEIEDGK